MNFALAKEIYGNPWFVDAASINGLLGIQKALSRGVMLEVPEIKYNTPAIYEISSETRLIQRDWQLDNNDKFDGIGIININGAITLGGGASTYGMEELSQMMYQMAVDERIKGFIVLTNSGGGASGAVDTMKDAIREIDQTKPVYGLIKKGGMAASAAYGILTATRKIYSASKMNVVGSSGTMIEFDGRAANTVAEDGTKHNIGESIDAKSGMLVVRNAGTFETATVAFGTALTAGQTMILGGLTYTSTGATTPAQLAIAFSNLATGATTGPGLATGTYSGTLAGWSTGTVVDDPSDDTVVFTASTVGNVTNLAATGTGTAPTITTISGTAGTQNGFSPATSANLADVIGILKMGEVNTMANAATLPSSHCVFGDIDTTLLILRIVVTLTTLVGNKALKDVLTGLGFVLKNVTELSNYGN